MSYFDDASLVMIPSGYKTSKVYSVKPTDGTGDLTFTRSNSTATRVASNGLIEKVRTNLVLQSVWPSIGTGVAPTSWVVGSGPATSFSAGPLAGQLLCNTSASRGFITQSVSLTAGEYALSVFVDSVTTTNAVADLVLIFGSTNRKYYEDGVEVDLNTNVVAGKRYAMVGTVTTGSFSMRIGSGLNTNATANYVISRPQLEVSDFGATDYIATTTAAVSVGPVANVPRLDYLGSSCPRLLLEPQRTNLITFSEQLNNAAWTKFQVSTTANATSSPDGYTNADKVAETATSGLHEINPTAFSAISGTAYTASFFAKAAERSFFRVILATGYFGVGNQVVFDLSTGVVSSQTGTTGSIVSYGNGWYRCSVTGTSTVTGSGANVYVDLATNATTFSYAGTAGSGLFLYGFQTEAGAYATSYIPTLGAAVTRGADACSKTGISSLIGQSEGTLFADFVWTKVGKTYQSIILGGSSGFGNTVYILTTESSGAASYQLRIGGTTAIATLNTTFTTGTRYKIALAYKSGSIAFYVNGISVGTSSATYGAVSEAISQFRYDWPYGGDEQWCSPVNQTLLFKTRLTNAQLAELTTI